VLSIPIKTVWYHRLCLSFDY